MILLGKILKVIGYLYLVLAIGFILMNLYFVWINEGFSVVQEILSPFNVANLIITLLTLAPGLLLLLASKYISKDK